MKNFLEKDLESIIWENFVRCAEKGLAVDQAFFQYGKCYRQLNLAPYGIADLIYIHYSPSQTSWNVLVLELKRGKIDLAAYQQAKRYQTALHALLRTSRIDAGHEAVQINFTTVLVGSEVETGGDFLYVFNFDPACKAFTYSYGFDGIAFEEVQKDWRHSGPISVPSTVALSGEWAYHRVSMEQGYAAYSAEKKEAEAQATLETIAEYGDFSKALIISAEGVLLNAELLALPDMGEEQEA